ncbi:MAG: deoxyribonuclease IV [Syntrophaceae bacterium]|nr:deoxyribonuclease IV [Syntrophaceae bacterium]
MPAFPHRLGLHVSIAGGIEKAADRARELGCTAMQIFSRTPRGWNPPPLPPASIRIFKEKITERAIDPVVVHTPYLLNLASGNGALYRRSVGALLEDLKRAALLGAKYVVTHLGSSGEEGPDRGRRKVVEALKKAVLDCPSVTLLLENSAGAGRTVGASLEEMGEIVEEAGEEGPVGFCFDTCHGFAAGYDFRSEEQSRALVGEIDRTVGLGRLKILHLNDCGGPLGGHLDRHQHIGKGKIGLSGFRSLLRQEALRRVPLILETPKDKPGDDRRNLFRVQSLLKSL